MTSCKRHCNMTTKYGQDSPESGKIFNVRGSKLHCFSMGLVNLSCSFHANALQHSVPVCSQKHSEPKRHSHTPWKSAGGFPILDLERSPGAGSALGFAVEAGQELFRRYLSVCAWVRQIILVEQMAMFVLRCFLLYLFVHGAWCSHMMSFPKQHEPDVAWHRKAVHTTQHGCTGTYEMKYSPVPCQL